MASSPEYISYSGGYRPTRNSSASERMDSLSDHHHQGYPEEFDNHHHHHHHYHHRRDGTVKRGQFTRSLSNTEAPSEDKAGEDLLEQ